LLITASPIKAQTTSRLFAGQKVRAPVFLPSTRNIHRLMGTLLIFVGVKNLYATWPELLGAWEPFSLFLETRLQVCTKIGCFTADLKC
jgi:hypothetical protein